MDNETIIYYRKRHEKVLRDLVNDAVIPAPQIKDAMLYSLFPGGTLFRPVLVYLCGSLMNVNLKSLDIIAAAVELIHSASMVHDDLPAMDNDDQRRAKLSCHRAFDEATAILVGDGMQMLAIDLLLSYLPEHLPLTQVISISRILTRACGTAGMVSGQSLDLTELSNPDINEVRLQEIHSLKTGELITACVMMALEAGESSFKEREALCKLGRCLGLAFQMHNDYLDRYGLRSLLGKRRDSDIANNKTTYAHLYSQQQLLTLILKSVQQAEQILTIFDARADNLLLFIHYLFTNKLHEAAPFAQIEIEN